MVTLMDKQYDNNMTGILRRNDKKKSEKSPEFTGNITINGVKYWQSAWVKESKDGRKYFSQSFTPVEPKEQDRQSVISEPDDVEIPF